MITKNVILIGLSIH